jgi:hypothetical protein
MSTMMIPDAAFFANEELVGSMTSHLCLIPVFSLSNLKVKFHKYP